MNRLEDQIVVGNNVQPRWRTPELKVESVAAMTGIDPVPVPPTDPSIYPGLGENS